MALQGPGVPISVDDIRKELGEDNRTSFSLRDAAIGNYVPINQDSQYKPDGNTPHSMYEWYRYEHNTVIAPSITTTSINTSSYLNYDILIVTFNENITLINNSLQGLSIQSNFSNLLLQNYIDGGNNENFITFRLNRKALKDEVIYLNYDNTNKIENSNQINLNNGSSLVINNVPAVYSSIVTVGTRINNTYRGYDEFNSSSSVISDDMSNIEQNAILSVLQYDAEQNEILLRVLTNNTNDPSFEPIWSKVYVGNAEYNRNNFVDLLYKSSPPEYWEWRLKNVNNDPFPAEGENIEIAVIK